MRRQPSLRVEATVEVIIKLVEYEEPNRRRRRFLQVPLKHVMFVLEQLHGLRLSLDSIRIFAHQGCSLVLKLAVMTIGLALVWHVLES